MVLEILLIISKEERQMSNFEKSAAESDHQVPETNKTSLGLYVTGPEAYAMWKADPHGVNILDVRTFEEYIFVGHLEMARNIPLVFPKYEPPDDEAQAALAGGPPPGCHGEPNLDFVSTAKEMFNPTETILVYCATGGRGAMAVNQLAAAGFVNVYNIINGLEGDRVDDPGSVYNGKHMRNGWKNAGLPWGYDFHPDLMWASAQ
jgi:rhodanese-related sulfurtransferase